MGKKKMISKENLRLAATYSVMNDKGRGVLDMVTQKLAEIEWVSDEAKCKGGFIEERKRKNN